MTVLKCKRVLLPFISDCNAEMVTAALTQEGAQVRWIVDEERPDDKHVWVEVIVAEHNIKETT